MNTTVLWGFSYYDIRYLKLMKKLRVYVVKGTRISTSIVKEGVDGDVYKTRNAARRAVARYRKENGEYIYSHPGSETKNVQKFLKSAFDQVFENDDEYEELRKLTGAKTVKINKIVSPGLKPYKRGKIK